MAANHYNRKIFNAATIVATLSFVAKLISALKDLVVAAWFGAGENVDAFILGALLPLLSVSVFSSPFGLALLPHVVSQRVSGSARGAFIVFEKSLVKFIFVLATIAAILYFAAPVIAHGLTPDRGVLLEKTEIALRVTALLVIVMGISQNLVTMLGAFENFALPAISQAIAPLGTIAALWYFPEPYQMYALPVGAVCGNGAQLVIVFVCYLMERRRTSATELSNDEISFGGLWRDFSVLLLSTLLMSSTDIVDQLMAARLGSGEVALLSYGTKVTAVVISIVAGALASAAFPYLSQMIERREDVLLKQTLFTYTRLILVFASVAAILLSVFSLEIIGTLFERGKFTATETAVAAFVQEMAVLQLPFYLLNILYMRVIMARRIGGYLTLVTVVSISLNIVLNTIFSRYYGVAGIALSTSCVYLWSSCALAYLIRAKS